jgi:DNA-binding response OmpR family regulator
MRKPVILIIDDDVFYRTTLSDGFSEIGYKCYTAPDGNEGFRLYGKIVPDVVVLDRIMPDSGGTRFLMSVKDHPNRKDCLLIIYSSTVKEDQVGDDRRSGSHIGFSRVVTISKSIAPGGLVEQIRDLIPLH